MNQDQLPEHSFSLRAARPSEAEQPHVATESELMELDSFINELLAVPAEQPDTRVVALVRRAMKARPRFSSVLAMWALRLDQRLRQAQREVIRLQWELAHLRQRERAGPTRDQTVED